MREIRKFEPGSLIRIPFTSGSDSEERLKKFLQDQVRSKREGLQDLFESKLPLWRKAYEARPAEQTRSFPFQNASNLVVPIIAIHSDTLLARVMANVLKTRPPWVSGILGGSKMEDAEGIKGAIEEFMQYVGLEPEELDLYRIYHEWFGETIRYGTSVVKSPIEQEIEDIVVAGDGTGRQRNLSFDRQVVYQGPRPGKIPFNKFLIGAHDKTIESAQFKAHIVTLHKWDLEQRRYMQVYDATAVSNILDKPDRTAPDSVQDQAETDAGAKTVAGYGYAEWDIYECHFKYRYDGDKFVRCIAFYHEKSNQILRAYFNYYPIDIFVAARLFYRDDAFHGYGFSEILANHQEELSQIHNQRRDNMTVANTRVWRVNEDSKLHQGYKIYPSAMLPAGKDEIEPLAHGELSQISIEEEQQAMELAERRSGVSPPQQGAGAGSFGKRGVYSAMGTLSLLQEGNSRTDLNVSDIRYAHAKLGRILLTEYAMTGLGKRKEMFAEVGEKLETAFDLLRKGRVVIPIQSSSASINREVEKQNDIMLTKMMQGHYQGITNMLGMLDNPMIPESVKAYMGQAVLAANNLMKIVLKHFEFDEVDRLAPEPKQKSSTPPQPEQEALPPGAPPSTEEGGGPLQPPGGGGLDPLAGVPAGGPAMSDIPGNGRPM